MKVDISLNGASRGLVKIDGVDWARHISGIRFEAKSGGLTKLVLESQGFDINLETDTIPVLEIEGSRYELHLTE